MAMSRKLWAINGLAVELDRDRRVVADAVGHLPPDGKSAGRPAWFMSTAVRALTVGGDSDGMLDPAQERARKDRALAEQTEMKNAERRGELVNIEEVGVAVEREFSVVRERSLSITGKLGDKLSPEQLRWVEDEIREALSDLSNGEDIEPVQRAKAQAVKAKRRD
ncbi:hypothetical protein [Methylobacterium pseudosasicola]|uniref:Terminase small subunit n=1 Tax=Methylobacterium pseudosasicola TaxID=582667 RepID=A0A1I4V9N2_9HYPH|nr:hypothetical protein [Methylobacterium pseudosasicola]SFM97903.1 hypothetical protein SAMN05192568_10912 [Methylobacterium pseudosasicola]